MTWDPPREFDEYRLLKPVGAGRTGLVWLASDSLLERTVAIKFIPAPDAVWLQRFLVEARAAARVQHPNVVTLYRVGQVGDHAYLVSEYVRGDSLDRVPRPLPAVRVLQIASDLARGLSAAHRGGVLHRDLKPGNAVQAETGDVKLVDFGLAKIEGTGFDVTRGPVGTPHFIAPELWRGEEATARSDLWSLGAVVYELAAGRGPFRDVPLPALPAAVQQADPPPLLQAAPALDPRLASAIDRCLRRDPAERFASADELLDALEQLRAERWGAPPPDENPYRGLEAFRAEHRALFFGRRRDLRAAIDRLRRDPMLVVTGDSGVGKSSLCMAGLLPALQDGALADGREWRTVRFVPGRAPSGALLRALQPVLGTDAEGLEAQVRVDPGRLARALRLRLGATQAVAIYVDQLEELVTLSRAEEAEVAARALAVLADDLPGVKLLASARSDFLTRLAGLPGLGEAVQRSLHLLRGLRREEIREVIVGPARATGTRFESEAMIEALVQSTAATESGLPLLQFALAELWQARDQATGTITADSLERIGGVSGALARHADGVIAALLPGQRAAARRMLLRLVTLEGTRIRRSEEELMPEAPGRAALEALVRGRLLVARDAEGGTRYEIAHEALLAGWGTLAGWLADEAEARALRVRLESGALEWDRAGRAREQLWSQRQVDEVAGLAPQTLTPREREFLAASVSGARRARLLRRVVVLGFLAALLTVYGGLRWKAWLDRRDALRAQLQSAANALETAKGAQEELEQRRRAAFRLFDDRRRDEAERAWASALEAQAARDRAFSAASGQYERAAALGGQDSTTRVALADFLVERIRVEDDPHRKAELRERLRIYDDGSRLRALDAPARLELQGPATLSAIVDRKVTAPRAAAGVESLAPGAWLLTQRGVRLALLLGPGESLGVPPPPSVRVPEGFALIPAGRFLFGTAAAESVREFFNAPPIHPLDGTAFLVARHETTYAEWLEFLDALAPAARAKRTPHVGSTGLKGELDLRRVSGAWQLTIQLGGRAQRLRPGDRLHLPARKRRVDQDWLRLPVSGVSFDDARAYAAWLDATGRVKGARLCTEHEWERAARGADDREFPNGDRLAADDANFDQTYGKDAGAFGPDEVGSHPASRSVYGVDDMAGNVWEWVESSLTAGESVARGGSYYAAANTCRSTNREVPERTFRALVVGVRVCASVPLVPPFPR